MRFNWVLVMYCKSILVIAGLLFFSCQKKADLSAVKVIGHGGMGLDFQGSVYHDNSEEAFSLALDLAGCDGIEMDVRLSADGDLWAFHDEVLDAETDNQGCIENKTFNELNGSRYKGLGGEKLKRLKDMQLELQGKLLFLDVKHFNACTQSVVDLSSYLLALNELPEYYHYSSSLLLVTSNPSWIPDLLLAGYSVLFSSDVESEIDAVFQTNPTINGVVIKNKSVSKSQISAYREAGKSVYLYEVRSPKKLKEAGIKCPDGVMSDDVQSAILEYN